MLGGRHSQGAAAELERTFTTLATFSNLTRPAYSTHAKFTGTETDKGGGTTDFCLDDTAINVS